ncbi:cell division inhibitor, putative [Pseudomonas psychrotolerans L19]|jgi:cell division inhibitor SulA|uniref:SOS cell division inhibitor SulA n=1 Tax=Ectopseudomonas oleovorans TaxID=301 RepID=A0A3D9ED83_ECTOL|nr:MULTISPECIES: SOS-induced cell division inhibitor SulA [Pseudomonas]HCV77650.1 cell division protein [Pseudomonas sp.]EHK69215.1 cell division inhibitor, putative [Pseudomonas psychrotolerans L19]KTT56570.1 cell division protein [Pseudomonas psychrotolerans]MBA1181482.1 cell division protein [Pseudomonas psychrotolerans]MBA1259611.1 cell division protein [Pseudomonas psychrotolerans]
MQFPLMFDAPRSSVQELDLAPEFLLQELTAFLPKPGKPARELPAAPLPDTFSEMSLHGSQEQCLQLLAPILRQLSDKDDARWLTLVTPPSLLSNAWLRSTHLNPERVLLLQTPSAAKTLQLACEVLRKGQSHTVISWLHDLSDAGKQQLARAAAQGNSQSLNVRFA